jgi:GNAT superfamily N-acetyltransferase
MPPRPRLTFAPLTAESWDAFERLVGEHGACGGCWCMYWRLTSAAYEAGKGDGNRRAFRAVVRKGGPTGVLAYDGDTPVGWCAVAPREEFVRLERSRVLKPIDERPVWSVVCLFVARSHRRRGVSVALLRAAADYARERGATLLEGYPVTPKSGAMPDAFAWTGIPSAFEAAGFREVARGSETRPIMRLDLTRRPGRIS